MLLIAGTLMRWVYMIRRARVKWLTKEDAIGQALFIGHLSGLVAA